ncbi:MAG: hypothetical protein V4561_09640 [Bacteroidota bacterium]
MLSILKLFNALSNDYKSINKIDKCLSLALNMTFLIICLLFFNVSSSAQVIRPFVYNTQKEKSISEYYLQPNKIARTYSSDSILHFLNTLHLQKENIFVSRSTSYFGIVGLLHRYNEILIFNEQHFAYKFHPEHSCVNNTAILSYNNFSKLPIDSTKKLDTFLSYIQPISTLSINKRKVTAIIFWNFSTGIKSDDNPFEWLKILRNNYGDEINILLVNMDVNESWPEDIKVSELAHLEKIIKLF